MLRFGYMTKTIIKDEELPGNLSEVSIQISKAFAKLSIDSKAFQETYKDLQIGINASALSDLSAKISSGISGHLQNSPLINLSGMSAIPAKTPSMTVPTLGDWYQEPKSLRFEIIIED